MATRSSDRETLPITLTPAARDVIRGIRDETGVPNTTAIERLAEWFGSMPKKFRLALLSRDEATRNELLMDWFRESLNAKGLDVDVREGDDYASRSKQITKLLGQMQIIHDGVREVAAGKKLSKGAK